MDESQKEIIEKLNEEAFELNKEINDLSEQMSDRYNKIHENRQLIINEIKEYAIKYYTGKHIQMLDHCIYEVMSITNVSDVECMLDEYRMYAMVKVTKLETNEVSDDEVVHMFTVDIYGKLKSFALTVLD